MAESREPGGAHRTAARRAAALAIGALLAIVLVELGVRGAALLGLVDVPDGREIAALLDRIEGDEFAPASPEKQPGEERDAHGMALHPYLGFQLEHFLARRDAPSGYWESAEAERNFDVLLLGGSVAAGAIEHWKSIFAPRFAADPRFTERPVRLTWRTCPGHKQPQHALNLQWALSIGDRPDLVLLVDGFNELAVAAQNAQSGVHPLYPMWTEMDAGLSGSAFTPAELALLGEIGLARREARRLADRSESSPLRSAALATWTRRELASLAARVDGRFGELERSRAAAAGARPSLIAGPPFAGDARDIERISLAAWFEGSRSMHAACRARGIRFVHVLQPAARDPGAKPLSEEEDARTREPEVWRTAIESGYPKLRGLGARLAAEGVVFVDASDVFRDVPEPIYRDACHFGEDGYQRLAERVVAGILASLPERL